MQKKGKWKVCSRGHKFYKTSDCPVCPKCWSGYYKKQLLSDFPKNLGAPALRGLLNAKIKNLKALSKWKEEDVKKLHGVGPNAIGKLKAALKTKKLSFKK
jgi:hypothetical protein